MKINDYKIEINEQGKHELFAIRNTEKIYVGEVVGEKEMVIFANGNNRDYRKENLVKITWSERLQLNQAHAIGNEEYMRTMLEIIRTKQKIREVANAKH